MTYLETALTDKATLKAWFDPPIPVTDTNQDTALDALIARVSAVIVEALDRSILATTQVTEKRNGNGQPQIQARHFPITAVSLVKIGLTTVPASVDGSAGYVFDEHTIYLIGYDFTRGSQNITLTYTAGYGQTAQIWKGLEQAALVTCNSWWKRRRNVDVVSQSNQSLQTTSFSTKDLPAEARMIIDRYRRKVPF